MSRLARILDRAADTPASPSPAASSDEDVGAEDDAVAAATPPHLCVECTDQPSVVRCAECAENYCIVCHGMLHRTGTRRLHHAEMLSRPGDDVTMAPTTNAPPRTGHALLDRAHSARASKGASTAYASGEESGSEASAARATPPPVDVPHAMPLPEGELVDSAGIIQTGDVSFADWISERAKYIPLRLEPSERKLLRLLEAALNVSEYTDRVDVIMFTSKTRRIVHQIRDICAILSGLLVACDYKAGQELLAERDFAQNARFFQNIFEIGRRHKIMNPEKMRTAYGKLMYMLQDSVQPEVAEALEFSCVSDLRTVYTFLQAKPGGLDLLRDPLIAVATKEIMADGKSRRQVQAEIKQKVKAVDTLAGKHGRKPVLRLGDTTSTAQPLTEDEVRWCLYSIGDNHSYLRSNRDPCDKMIRYLTTHFHPERPGSDRAYSLAIASGRDGARLSHSHSAQYHYVHQTLHLWREIQHDMFMLWCQADKDLLSDTHAYRLRDTGQGLNRVQACPNVSREIHAILHRAQQRCGYWVGSSVVHLGDRNVPNALMFIDKYNQVPRILNPIARCLEQLDNAADQHPALLRYCDAFHGGVDATRRLILADFFRSAFDGSGADNFFDAGSCIDGRLTSAWNWCSTIEKKPYYPVLLLTGFMGFDGDHFAT